MVQLRASVFIGDTFCSSVGCRNAILFNRLENVVWNGMRCWYVVAECPIAIGIGLISQQNWNAFGRNPLGRAATRISTQTIFAGRNAVWRFVPVVVGAIGSQILFESSVKIKLIFNQWFSEPNAYILIIIYLCVLISWFGDSSNNTRSGNRNHKNNLMKMNRKY